MTNTQIANMALLHLGITQQISDLDSDTTPQGRAIRVIYETALNCVLRDFDWPFARKRSALTVDEEEPNDEWGFSYDVPADCVAVRRIFSGIRNDSRATRAAFELIHKDDKQVIFCDVEDAVLRYTSLITNPAYYTSDFQVALSARIAAYVAPAVTGGDPFKVGQRAYELYRLEIGRAWANAANEEQPEEPPPAEMISAREGGWTEQNE